MKCEDFLPALETGGPLRRRRAQRHAARCVACAAAAERLAAMKRQWADTPPIGLEERVVWERAAVDDPGVRNIPLPAPPRRLAMPTRFQWWAAAACVLLVVSIAVTLAVRHQTVNVVVRPQPVPTTTTTQTVRASQPGPIRVEPADGAGELEHLATAVDQLDVQMQELRRKAERAEARSQIASALDRFGH